MSTNLSPIIDLDIRIIKRDETAYAVTAQAPDSGLAESQLDAAPLLDDAFQEQLAQIREEPFATDEALFRGVGATLFQALFQGQVRDLFQSLWLQKVQSDEGDLLRLRLNIDEAAIELATLPWEMMHWQDVFLSTQLNTLLTRQLLNLDYGNIPSLQIKGRPRVLLVAPGGSGLNVEAEITAIRAALDKADVPYEVLAERVSLQLLDDTLAQGDYAILHFIGHATFEQDASGQVHGRLRFNRLATADTAPDDDEDWAPETDLQALLGNHKGLKLVVLNACHTGELTQRPQDRGFWGIIPALLRAGLPAVVAMQYAIRDDVAALFGETFYKRLVAGKWAGHVDAAVTFARNACFLAFPDDRGFATPALYLRSRDGVIFEPTATSDVAGTPDPEVDCAKAPKPPDHLLYRYRNSDLETLITRIAQAQSRLQRLTFQIDALRAQRELDEKAQWRLHRYEKNRDDLERELDAMQDVLLWRRYEACEKLRDLQARLAQKQEEKTTLEDAGAYISYELKNTIFTLGERVLKLQALLQEADALFQD